MKKSYAEKNVYLTKEEGDAIAERLKATRLSHQRLAVKLGISRGSVSGYINREMNPSPKIAALITEVLDGMGR